MGYEGFWGFTALTALLILQGVYVLRKEIKGKALVEIPSKVKIFFGVLGGLCAVGFVVGAVMILCKVEAETVHVTGLIMTSVAFVMNVQLRKFAPVLVKKEKQEEEINE